MSVFGARPCALAATAAVVTVALSGCAGDPPLPKADPPAPPAACVLDTATLASATDVDWTPDQSTATDTRCVYDAQPTSTEPTASGTASTGQASTAPQFLTVSLFKRTQADASAERELLAQLCQKGSRIDVNTGDGGFVCRFDGDLVYGALVRGDQVVQVSTSAIPAATASATLAAAINDQLAGLSS